MDRPLIYYPKSIQITIGFFGNSLAVQNPIGTTSLLISNSSIGLLIITKSPKCQIGTKSLTKYIFQLEFHIEFQHFEAVGASHLLYKFYNDSVTKFLEFAFPEYKWLPWKFPRVPNKYWDKFENQCEFMVWAGNELGIKSSVQWLGVSGKVWEKVNEG